MATLLVLLTCIGAATIGGVFFAFSAFVMKALAQLPPSQGAAAMQRINVVVLNPFFLGVFFGTAVLALACVAMAFFPLASVRSALLLASAGLYLIGTFAVTVVFNVPRNERLARMADRPDDAVEYWPVYVREWTRWNHVRTVAAIASAACAALALTYPST